VVEGVAFFETTPFGVDDSVVELLHVYQLQPSLMKSIVHVSGIMATNSVVERSHGA